MPPMPPAPPSSRPRLLVTLADPAPDVRAAIEARAEGAFETVFLCDRPDMPAGEIAGFDCTLSMNLPREVPAAVVARAGWRLAQMMTVGLDHLDFAALPAGLAVAGNPGAYAEPMAEHALALALALCRRLLPKHAEMARGVFDQTSTVGTLRGATLGVFGFGGIGKATARLMAPWGVRVHAVTRSGRTDAAVEWIGTRDQLPQLLRAADILLIAAPLNRDTRGAIGAAELALMKPDAMLLNLARGEIVDQDALWNHLRANPRFMAGIDAWWIEPFRHGRFELAHPFLDLPNVVGSPHNSGFVEGAMAAAAGVAVDNLRLWAEGGQPRGLAGPEDRPD